MKALVPIILNPQNAIEYDVVLGARFVGCAFPALDEAVEYMEKTYRQCSKKRPMLNNLHPKRFKKT